MKKISLCLFAILLAFSALVMAAPPKDAVTITAQDSDNGISPTTPNPFPHNWFYSYCLQSGQSLNDTLHIRIQVADGNSASGPDGFVIFSSPGVHQISTTLPGSKGVRDDGTNDLTVDIPVSLSNPADGNYNRNIGISVDSANNFTLSHNNIHIQVTVGAGCSQSSISCFMTDSNFNLLTDCSAVDVTGSSGGTFQIVPNTKKTSAVATNPGQFYYNLIWTNTGADLDVTVTLSSNGLIPSNTGGSGQPIGNAVHAATFDSSGFAQNFSNWDFVNTAGLPCGPYGPCTIHVGSNQTLWVTWHLVWSGIGGPLSGISVTCPGNVNVSASGSLKDSNGDLIDSCEATMSGYKKK